MYGIDISNHQSKIDLSRGNYDFAIIKATEGVGFIDQSFKKFAEQLTELDKLIGCYHFARPDLHNTVSEMEEEADWFVKVVKDQGLLNKAILVLDWEVEPMDRKYLMMAWVLRVENQTGITPFIYSGKYKLSTWKNWWVIQHCPIWMAVWPSINRHNVGVDPGYPLPKKVVKWLIWQYSSTGIYPGYPGNIDLNYAEINKQEWEMYAGVEKDVPEVISDDMKWAINEGLFAGYEDGKFYPENPVTREQLATVLRRYDKGLKDDV